MAQQRTASCKSRLVNRAEVLACKLVRRQPFDCNDLHTFLVLKRIDIERVAEGQAHS
jgi:hypothetical protein